ncbi:MAG: DNA polymerase IV [Candidatus Woesearchaeota archaeon]|nr:MAG: DNA polymerase IV [Candidatus Woesearchaeota archaeon]
MTLIAHVDMDCFFCSCEERDDKTLANKPFAIGQAGTRGVISSANYLARTYGIHAAMPVFKAKTQCKELVIVEGNFRKYSIISRQIMQQLALLSPRFYQASIDEAYVDISHLFSRFNSLEEIGNHVKEVVRASSQISCSVGIASCALTAKIACASNKPAGVTVVTKQREFLSPLDISVMPGIGKQLAKNMRSKGIQSLGDLGRCAPIRIKEWFGERALYFWQIVRAEKETDIPRTKKPRSVSKEQTFLSDTKEVTVLLAEIRHLAKEVSARLGKKFFRTIAIKIKYGDFTTITREETVRYATNSQDALVTSACKLFYVHYDRKRFVRLVGVKAGNIDYEASLQTTLDIFMKR